MYSFTVVSLPLLLLLFLPSQELIQETPNSLASLLEHLLPRLQPRAELRGVSLEDQQNFVSVVTLLLVVFFVVVVLFVCLFIYLFFGCFNL